jgi:hypothetical protein
MRAGRALGLGLLLLSVAALSGCGEADDPAAPRTAATTTTPASGEIELKVEYAAGAGAARTTGELVCRAGEMRATGALFDGKAPAALCAQARALTNLLTTQPDKDRMCTQIYGGPETARVTGTIDGTKVDRRFTRTNGCEVADFSAAAGLLQP